MQITANEPSPAVVQVVTRGCSQLSDAGKAVQLLEAPFSPLAERERFMELRQWQLSQLPSRGDYGAIWDDDHILEDPAELVRVLQDGADLVYATKIHFWDSPRFYTTRLPVHNSVFVFRQLPGDSFPLDRVIHAPGRVHDSAEKVVQLKGHLLDYGYMRAEDRKRCWDDYRRVGKIDAATTPLVQPPATQYWHGLNPFE